MYRLFVALFGTCALLATSAAAEDAKYVKIVHVESGKVLAVKDNSTDSESPVVLAKDDGNEAQQWQLVKDDKHLKIVNRKSKKVLDVNNESTDEGADIIIWDDKAEGNDNQRWSWVGTDKTRQLKSKHSSLVLAPDGDGKVIQKKADDKAKGQLWEVVEVAK